MLTVDLIYTAFVFPAFMAVPYSLNTGWRVFVDMLVGPLFVLDVLIHLHLPIVVTADFSFAIVNDGPSVCLLYRTRGTFWVDVLAAVPWFMQLSLIVSPEWHLSLSSTWSGHFMQESWAVSLMSCLRLLRLLRVFGVVGLLARGDLAARWSQRTSLRASTMFLLSLVYSSLATINLLACLWLHVGLAEAAVHEPCWLSSVGDEDLTAAALPRQFLASYYFTVTTITTVGYGDVTPKNATEQAFAILIMLCGALFLSYVISSVATIMNAGSPHAKRAMAFREKVQWLDRWFCSYPAPRKVQSEVYAYYARVWTRVQQETELWEQLSVDLPTGLRATLLESHMQSAFGPLFTKLFTGLPRECVLGFCGALDRQVVAPATTLAWSGEPFTGLWLLQHGSVKLLYPRRHDPTSAAAAAPEPTAAATGAGVLRRGAAMATVGFSTAGSTSSGGDMRSMAGDCSADGGSGTGDRGGPRGAEDNTSSHTTPLHPPRLRRPPGVPAFEVDSTQGATTPSGFNRPWELAAPCLLPPYLLEVVSTGDAGDATHPCSLRVQSFCVAWFIPLPRLEALIAEWPSLLHNMHTLVNDRCGGAGQAGDLQGSAAGGGAGVELA